MKISFVEMNQLKQPEFTHILPIEIGQEIYNGNILAFSLINDKKRGGGNIRMLGFI